MLAAYPQRVSLERLLSYRLERRLNDLVGNEAGMQVVVFRLITAAREGGWIGALVDAVLKDRPDNAALRSWARRHWVAPAGVAIEPPPPAVQLLNTAFFDLNPIRRRIIEAKGAAGSRLLGFGVHYPEMLFVDKLCDWLPYCLGELARKDWLSLRPEMSSVDTRIKHVTQYLGELASVNVVCRVFADRVPTDSVGAFWQGVREQCGEPDSWFVFIFAGTLTDGYPPGIVALDPPAFDRSDLTLWAQEVVSRLTWPAPLADAWCQLIAERSGDPHGLDVRLVYEAMDRSISHARHDPAGFRRLLEERV